MSKKHEKIDTFYGYVDLFNTNSDKNTQKMSELWVWALTPDQLEIWLVEYKKIRQ